MEAEKQTLIDRVRQCAADIFELPLASVTLESSPDTIDNWDSVNHLSFVLALEEEFGLEFLPQEVVEMLNIDLAVLTVQEKLAQQ